MAFPPATIHFDRSVAMARDVPATTTGVPSVIAVLLVIT
jgi:hypothetical protein